MECDWISFEPFRIAFSISELAAFAVVGLLDLYNGSIFEKSSSTELSIFTTPLRRLSLPLKYTL